MYKIVSLAAAGLFLLSLQGASLAQEKAPAAPKMEAQKKEVSKVGKIMIKCPNTGKPVFTGMAMDKKSFESSTFEINTVSPCPHCGKAHTWNKVDAYWE